MKRTGFSLIELLVVIALAAILLTLLLPGMKSLQDRAARLKCAHNLQQLGYGITHWSGDNQGTFPRKEWGTMYAWYGTSGKRGGAYTRHGAKDRILNAYIGGPYTEQTAEVPLARCPRDTRTWVHASQSHYEHFGTSYGSNTKLPARYDYDRQHPRGVTIEGGRDGRAWSQVKKPSQFVMMTEEGPFLAVWWNQGLFDANPSHRVFWHGAFTWNAVFADGHVKFITVRNQEWLGRDYSFDYRF